MVSPLPFGCVGKFWWPLFYLAVLGLTWMGLRLVPGTIEEGGEAGRPLPHKRWIGRLFWLCLGFLALQLLPLPLSLLKILSPHTVTVLSQLRDTVPAFHAISLVPFETLLFGVKVLILGLFFWVLIHLSLSRREIVSIFKIMVLGGFLQTLFGLAKYVTGNRLFFLFFYPHQPNEFSNFLTGTLGNANHFAFFLEMIFPLSLALFLLKMGLFEEGRSWRERVLHIFDVRNGLMFYFAALLLMALGVFLTASRAGIVTFFLSLVVFFLLSLLVRFRKLRKRLALIVLCVMVGITIWGGQDTVDKFMKLKTKRPEGIGRLVRWPATFKMAGDFIFMGTGLGTYRYSYFLYDREGNQWVTHAHSDVLEMVAEGGVVGGLLFFSLFGLTAFSITRVWWQRRRVRIKVLGLGVLVGLFAAAFHSFFDFSLRIPGNVFLLVLLLGLGVKIVTYRRDKSLRR